MRIAFAGNPNSGKTTMYNVLTGSNEKVGNWAGVTVEKKAAPIKKAYSAGQRLVAVDLPGAYSMSAFTVEESITADYVKGENPDVIVNIVDATNLSRSLFFTTQLLELGIPMVVALNKADMNEKRNRQIDTGLLAQKLGCPVVDTAAISGEGLKELVAIAVKQVGTIPAAPCLPQTPDRERYAFVNELVSRVETAEELPDNIHDRMDTVMTHGIWGVAIFAAVIFLVFQISQAWVGPWLADHLVGAVDAFKAWIADLLTGSNAFLSGLLTEGIIGGVSAVIGFLPLVMVMYFMLSLLEDCGYMARVTVVLDPVFQKVGLSGKSVIPFVVGTGCAIPGVMAVRTIRDRRQRNATAMLTPFMPCGAKLPVIALFAGAFFADAPWVGTLMYFAGIVLILLCALLVNKITGCGQKSTYFIIELPDYKLPSIKRAFLEMCSRGWAYVVKAGTVILLCNTVVYLMQSFDWHLQLVGEGNAQNSILATVATPFAYVLLPVIGIRAWQMAAAAITGFIAKENVVGTLAVCYGISNLIDTEALALQQGAGNQVAAVFGITKVAALAYLTFNLFTPPCFAAIGAMRSELDDKKWLWGGLGLQMAVGFTVSYLIYTVGSLLVAPDTLAVLPAVLGALAVAVFAGILAHLIRRK